MIIYEGYFNNVDDSNDEIVKDIESNSMSDVIDNPDDYSSELMFEFSFAGTSLSSIDKDNAYKDIKKIVERIKMLLEDSLYVDSVSDYMPVYGPSWDSWKNCTHILKEESTGLELRTNNNRDLILTTSMHYGILVFCNLHLNTIKDVIRFLKYCYAIALVKGIREDYKHPFVIAVLFNKIDGKELSFKYNLRLNTTTATLFLNKYKSSRQANWNQTGSQYSSKLLQFILELFGTGHIQEVLDLLDVSLNQIIIDNFISGLYMNTRKKRLGVFPQKNKLFRIDKFLEYAFPLCKEEVYIFDDVNQEFKWLFNCKFTKNKDSLRDWIVQNDALITAYWYRMTNTQLDVVVYIIDRITTDTDEQFVMFLSMTKDLWLESDYNDGNVADFITPLVELGAKQDTLIKNYLQGVWTYKSTINADNVKEMIEDNLK